MNQQEIDALLERVIKARFSFRAYVSFVHRWAPRPHQERWFDALQALGIGRLRHPGASSCSECRGPMACPSCPTTNKLLILAFPGCVSSDTIVHINRAGKGRAMPIAHAYRKWSGIREGSIGGPSWDRRIPTYARSLVDGELRLNRVLDIRHSGFRAVVEVLFASGRRLRCTPDHEVARPDGSWTMAGLLAGGDLVLANGKYVDRDGYPVVWGKEYITHPRAQVKHTGQGEIYEHLLVMEDVIGRPVLPEERVHHRNGVKTDNRPENLELLPSHAAHMRRHPLKYRHLDGGVNSYNGAVVRFVPELDAVEGVRSVGTEETYDLVMAGPWHNFVGDGIVVHNSGKTDTAIEWNAWMIGRACMDGLTPQMGFISYGDEVAMVRSVAIRDTIEFKDEYHLVFPEAEPLKDKRWASHEWFLKRADMSKKDPTFRAAGIQGGILSYRFPTAETIDDPHSEENVRTPGLKDSVWRTWRTTIRTRAREHTPILEICTRFAEDDLAGRQLQVEGDWHLLHTPALDEHEQSAWPLEDVNGEEMGISTEELLRLREQDPHSFLTQYQALPPSAEGDVFMGWGYAFDPSPFDVVRVYQCWDTSYTTNKKSSYSAMVEMLKLKDGRVFINHVFRKKLSFTDLELEIIAQYERARVDFDPTGEAGKVLVRVENKASGGPIVQRIQQQTAIPIRPVNIKRQDLELRAPAVSPYFTSNRVLLPQGFRPWKEAYEQEMRAFPRVQFRDQVSATVLGLELIFPAHAIGRPVPRTEYVWTHRPLVSVN